MRAIFTSIELKLGAIDNYLDQSMDLSKSKIDTLRKKISQIKTDITLVSVQ